MLAIILPLLISIILLINLIWIFLHFRSMRQYSQRMRHKYQDRLRTASFPPLLSAYLKQCYPHLNSTELEQARLALRDYFILCQEANMQLLAMPSKAADQLWHGFILCCPDYLTFCRTNIGRFMHHAPNSAETGAQQRRDSMALCWQLACQHEGLNFRNPAHIPRLFDLDRQLRIDQGNHYACEDGVLSIWRAGRCLINLSIPQILLACPDRDPVEDYKQKSDDSGCGGSSCGGGDGGGCGGCGGGCGGD